MHRRGAARRGGGVMPGAHAQAVERQSQGQQHLRQNVGSRMCERRAQVSASAAQRRTHCQLRHDLGVRLGIRRLQLVQHLHAAQTKRQKRTETNPFRRLTLASSSISASCAAASCGEAMFFCCCRNGSCLKRQSNSAASYRRACTIPTQGCGLSAILDQRRQLYSFVVPLD